MSGARGVCGACGKSTARHRQECDCAYCRGARRSRSRCPHCAAGLPDGSASAAIALDEAFRRATGCWAITCFDCSREEFIDLTDAATPTFAPRCSVCGGRRYAEQVSYGVSPYGSMRNAAVVHPKPWWQRSLV